MSERSVCPQAPLYAKEGETNSKRLTMLSRLILPYDLINCFLIVAVLLSLLALTTDPLYAAFKDVIVDSEWINQHRDGVIVVDVRDKGDYLKKHIKGAINIPVNDLQTKPDAILYPVPRLEKILGAKGLDIDKDIVLYCFGREMAYLEFWMLDFLGMRKLHIYSAGVDDWKGPTSTDETELPPAVFKARPDPRKYATTTYVKASLHKRSTILLDVRTPDEFRGFDVRSLRGGHIPGAINMDYDDNFDENTDNLKSEEELANLYGKLDRNKEIIVYCQTGTRAANTYVILRHILGFPKVRVYDASWIVWGTRLDLPAAEVSYFNFMSLRIENKKLRDEIEKLKQTR